MNLNDIKARLEATRQARLASGVDEGYMTEKVAFVAARSASDVPKLVAALEAVGRYLSDMEDGTPPEGFNGLATRNLVKNLRREIDSALA